MCTIPVYEQHTAKYIMNTTKGACVKEKLPNYFNFFFSILMKYMKLHKKNITISKRKDNLYFYENEAARLPYLTAV